MSLLSFFSEFEGFREQCSRCPFLGDANDRCFEIIWVRASEAQPMNGLRQLFRVRIRQIEHLFGSFVQEDDLKVLFIILILLG